MKSFEEAMNFRHACKIFDENKKVSKDDFNYILEAGRQSPSSFGLEPWHFLVVESDELKAKIRPICWDQPQVTTCSHFMIILFKRPHFFAKDSAYLERSIKRKAGDNVEMLNAARNLIIQHREHEARADNQNWAMMQCYLASGNMMTAAAVRGVDSCPIEGFDYQKLEAVLKENVPQYNAQDYGVCYCIAFGHRINPQSKQLRWDLDEVVTVV